MIRGNEMKKLDLPVVKFTPEQIQFRKEVRTFLEDERNKGSFQTHSDSWLSGYSYEF